MKFRWYRINYYLKSLLVILNNIEVAGWKTIKVKSSRIILKLNSWNELLVLKEVLVDREYEKIFQIDNGDKTIVDIGAGIGDFAIDAAKRFPKSKIYAFEADPKAFSILQENISNNNCKNIQALNIAARSLNQILEIVGKNIDFLKLDCEGCEFEILGRKSSAHLVKIKKIVLEYHSDHGNLQDIQKRLESKKFELIVVPQGVVNNIGHIYAICRINDLPLRLL